MSKKNKHNPDYLKNRTADVIKHGDALANPNSQWEMNRDITPEGESDGWGAFLPRAGRNRPTPYTKLNECDH
jgi:hypothetical protein